MERKYYTVTEIRNMQLQGITFEARRKHDTKWETCDLSSAIDTENYVYRERRGRIQRIVDCDALMEFLKEAKLKNSKIVEIPIEDYSRHIDTILNLAQAYNDKMGLLDYYRTLIEAREDDNAGVSNSD